MAISVTNVGTNAQSSGATNTLSGSAPSGVLIVVATAEASGGGISGGSCTDSASNNYSLAATNHFTTTRVAQLFYFNQNAIGISSIAYTTIAGAPSSISAFYATGIAATAPLDSGVTATATGTSATPTVTGGSALLSGELAVTWLLWVESPLTSFTQDSGHNWTAPPTEVTLGVMGGAGGTQINSSTGALTFSPSLSGSSSWIALIVGFKPVPPISNSEFDGAGSLLTLASLRVLTTSKLTGQGSLIYAGTLGLMATATMADSSPSLSAYANVSFATAAEFDGSGQINAAATRVPPGGFVALFNGSGALSANAQQSVRPAFTFAGNGQLLPTVFLIQQASAVFAGSGVMQLPLSGESNLNAAGSLEADTIWNPRIGFFTGFGLLSAYGYRDINVAQQFNGSGRMCTQATVRLGRRGPTTNSIQFGPGPSFNITVGGG